MDVRCKANSRTDHWHALHAELEKVAVERIVTPEILKRIHDEVRAREFLMKGFDGPVFAGMAMAILRIYREEERGRRHAIAAGA